MVKLRTVLLILCVWMLLSAPALAAADGSFRVLRINAQQVPAAEVIAGRFDARATRSPTNAIIPSTQGSWWRIDMLDAVPSEPQQALVVDAPNGTTVSAWLPGSSGPLIRTTTGIDADRTYSPSLAVFDLPDGLQAGQHFYLQVKSWNTLPKSVRIMDVHALRALDRRNLQVNMLIVGTLLSLTLVGIGMGMALHETDFLLLGIGLAFCLMFLLDGSGELYRIPWFAPLSGVRIINFVFSSGAAILMALFALSYLQMMKRTPWLARIQWAMVAGYVVVLIAFALPGVRGWLSWPRVGNLMILVSAAVAFVSAIKGAWAGHRAARLYLWSWAPMLFFLVWRILEVNLRWPPNDVLQIAFPASFVLAGVLMMIGLGDRMLKYKRERDASDLLAQRDPLTEVYNRRALDERLHAAALETGQSSQPLALLFLDLDHFKRINDEYGHDVGDECLREVARRIRGALRFGDVLGRYGGEEFVIGLPHTHVEDAKAMGERIRQAVGLTPIPSGDLSVGITISVGVAVLQDGLAGFDAAIKRADRALYASKRDGRDRVTVFSV